MSLQDDVNLLLTCAPGVSCPREEACFRVAKYLRDNLLDIAIRESLATVDDGVVDDYAPTWENRFVSFRDE